MITLNKIPMTWLTLNSKWLPSKPAEITLIEQWAQYWQYTPHIPAMNVRKLSILSQEQNKIFLIRSWGGGGAIGPID